MEKAKLYIDYLYVGALAGLSVECQFNPTELTINRSTSWEGVPVPERDFPRTEFKGGNASTYSLSLFFDAYATDDYKTSKPARRDVRKDINKLMAMSLRTYGFSLPIPYPYLGEPPSIIFVWGGVKLFRAVIDRGKGIEINCSGLRMPSIRKTLPSVDFIKLLNLYIDVQFLNKMHHTHISLLLSLSPPSANRRRQLPLVTTNVFLLRYEGEFIPPFHLCFLKFYKSEEITC